MKLKGPIFFSLAIISFLAVLYFPSKINSDKESVLIHTLLEGLNQLHYAPVEINDNFSNRVYDLYLERLDGGKRFLTEEDLVQMKSYKSKIDDESKEGTYEFFNLSVKLYEAGIKKAQGYYREILKTPFKFDANENIELKGEEKSFVANDEELKKEWHRTLKYDVMTRVADKLKEQEEAKEKKAKGEKVDEDFEIKTFETLEKEARESVLENFDDWFDRMNRQDRSDRLSSYLNAITNVFDPHTSYYEPKDKEDFDINMSGTLEGIGARLIRDKDYTKITEIIPGGPAWKGKDLQANDLIMKVRQENEEEPVDITGMEVKDVVKFIRGKKGTKVILTVKRVDGEIDDIEIVRDLVIIDESFAKSVILNQPGVADNIGYIKLPRFYADFNRREGRSCATDVAKELKKLKEQNVNGVILDLRNNGGGSLKDVVTMSGLFIEQGPIVQVKARDRKPEVLADEDPTVQYDGPLIVMVNNFSASASEILAAALQDYNRAVIVGSKSTFGKGTVQRFFDLDRAIRGNSDVKPLGEVKLTIQKFYRVNGGSTQLNGVTPDIFLPDNYTYITTGEQEHDYAMEWTEINPVNFKQKAYTVKDMKSLVSKSKKRVAANPTFTKIYDNARRLKEQREDTNVSLNMDTYRAEEKQLDEEAKKYKDLFTKIDDLKIANLEVDMKGITMDSSKIARNDVWIESMEKDVYIEESLHIMKDMIEQ